MARPYVAKIANGRELIIPRVESSPETTMRPIIPTEPSEINIGTPVTDRNTVIISAIVPTSREDKDYSTFLSLSNINLIYSGL